MLDHTLVFQTDRIYTLTLKIYPKRLNTTTLKKEKEENYIKKKQKTEVERLWPRSLTEYQIRISTYRETLYFF